MKTLALFYFVYFGYFLIHLSSEVIGKTVHSLLGEGPDPANFTPSSAEMIFITILNFKIYNPLWLFP